MAKILFDIRSAAKVERVYDDSDTKADRGISVFTASMEDIPEGYYMIGQAAVRQTGVKDVPKSSIILVKPSDPDLIKIPVNYSKKWNDKGSEGKLDGTFWRVIAPEGYVALGDVVTDNYSQPLTAFTNKFACIRQDLLVSGELNPQSLWNDKGSGADLSGSVWEVDGHGLAGLFKVQAGYDIPQIPVFVLPASVAKK
ncbi:uncharacterized protein LOC114525197 [Dendronephthya gigantea]|uniref:uncharacterized protein LOC114525197 n=1 Tax=Dendronephthya gigantea TaxID=151771 RepID=UPI00106CAA11|nr:uncharacterized protein LOC114525197 [Dendronephthya gigantea]